MGAHEVVAAFFDKGGLHRDTLPGGDGEGGLPVENAFLDVAPFEYHLQHRHVGRDGGSKAFAEGVKEYCSGKCKNTHWFSVLLIQGVWSLAERIQYVTQSGLVLGDVGRDACQLLSGGTAAVLVTLNGVFLQRISHYDE